MTGIVRKCFYFNDCHVEETYNGEKWKEKWAHYQGNIICESHYTKLIRLPRRQKIPNYNKKWNIKAHKIHGPKRIRFLGKRVELTFNPRTGYCSLCSNNVHDGSCKKTDRHHYFYVPIMMWACTEERCSSCHHRKDK